MRPDQGQKEEFAKRLEAAMERKGWTAGQTAREARRYLGQGEQLGDAHMWHYLHARSIPRSRYLGALSRALGISPEDLVGGAVRGIEDAHSTPALTVLDAQPPVGTAPVGAQLYLRKGKNGTVVLQINEEVPWTTALRILQLLKQGADSEATELDGTG
jgi:hypothetical protein